MNGYITVQEAALKWGISPRQVQILCKSNPDYPTGGSDAFKRGCFFLSSFHDEKFNCWYLNRVLKIKHRDTTSRLRTDRA